jgi:hypothetical protein
MPELEQDFRDYDSSLIGQLSHEACGAYRALIADARDCGDNDLNNQCQSAVFELQNAFHSPERNHQIFLERGWEVALTAAPPCAGTPTGDFFQIIPRSDGKINIFIGDATGHNDPDSWNNSVRFNGFIRQKEFKENCLDTESDPSALICMIDQSCNFKGRTDNLASVAVRFTILDPASGEFSTANGSMPEAYIVRRDGTVEKFSRSGFALNPLAFENVSISYDKSNDGTDSGILMPEDLLVIVSDGVTDAQEQDGSCVGNNLAALLATCGGKMPKEVEAEIRSHMIKVEDDATIFIIRRPAETLTSSTTFF